MNEPEAMSSGPIIYRMSSLDELPLEWVWPGRIPRGELSMLFGDPACGKTTLTLDICARITRGTEWPDREDNEPGSVLIMSGEDNPRRTILPRLRAAGADLDKVLYLDRIRTKYQDDTHDDRLPDLVDDVEHLRTLVAEVDDLRLIVVDPIACYLGIRDSNQASQVRRGLLGVHDFCAESGVGMLMVSHMNKGAGGKSMYRASGSLGFIAASRVAWLCHPEQAGPDSSFIMASAKSNLAVKPPALRYRVVSHMDDPSIPVIAWAESVDVTADELLVEDNAKPSTKLAECAEWLRQTLTEGPLSSDKLELAAEQCGYKRGTLFEAKKRASVKARKVGFDGHWEWYLP